MASLTPSVQGLPVVVGLSPLLGRGAGLVAVGPAGRVRDRGRHRHCRRDGGHAAHVCGHVAACGFEKWNLRDVEKNGSDSN